jgi:OOP family OmpA-OmpF porin
MMKNRNALVFLLFMVFIFAAGVVLAQGEDEKGSMDHPLISRFPGSYIMIYDVKDFNEYVLPLGRMEKGKLKKSQRLEGKVTQITYAAPADRSILEIYRNFELAFKNAGFETLFMGKKKELGDKWINEFVGATSRPERYGAPALGTRLEDNFNYLAVKLPRTEGDVYVALCAGSSWFQKFPVIQVDVIETKPMETGLVTVNAEALAKDIGKTGHVAIYGIYFDTGKADVKSESEPALREIVKLLQQNPALKLYVVGHTDNIGSLSSNRELSLRRAEAVVRTLIVNHGIDTARLNPVGVGPLAPVASNKSEEGRSKNRRVELVEQ